MDFLHSLGSLAFVNRIKGVSDLMLNDLQRIYKELDTDFEPRWMLLFQYLLKIKSEIPVTVISRELNLTHPAVIQVLEKVEKKGLVKTRRDKKDQRKRLVCLSQKGKELALKVSPIWDDIHNAIDELIIETDPRAIDILEKLEDGLERNSLYSRVKHNLKFRMLGDIKLIEYEEKYYDHLQDIYFKFLRDEKSSRNITGEVIKNTIDSIVKKGSKTYLMTYQEKLIGSFDIHLNDENEAEIKLFCIKKEYARWGMDEKLFEKALSLALNDGVSTIYFEIHKDKIQLKSFMMKQGFEQIDVDSDMKQSKEGYNETMKLVISGQ